MIRAALPLAVLAPVLLLGGCGGDESSDNLVAVTPASSPDAPELTLCGPITIDPRQIGTAGDLYFQGLNLSGASGITGSTFTESLPDIIIVGYHSAVAPAPASALYMPPGGTPHVLEPGADLTLNENIDRLVLGDCPGQSDDEPGDEPQPSFLYITADGLPDHDTGNFPNSETPYAISEQSRVFRVSVPPVLAEEKTMLVSDRFDGVLANGVPILMRETNCTGSAACGLYPGMPDPLYNPAMYGLDAHNAHVLADGSYHYHADPHTLYDDTGATAFQIIGVAADGFPIFGPWINDDGVIRRATSSYVLRTGYRFMVGPYDGTFTEDYEYIEGHGDLDECNGMLVNGVYGYFVTDTFPYILNCLRGTPQPSFDLPDET